MKNFISKLFKDANGIGISPKNVYYLGVRPILDLARAQPQYQKSIGARQSLALSEKSSSLARAQHLQAQA